MREHACLTVCPGDAGLGAAHITLCVSSPMAASPSWCKGTRLMHTSVGLVCSQHLQPQVAGTAHQHVWHRKEQEHLGRCACNMVSSPGLITGILLLSLLWAVVAAMHSAHNLCDTECGVPCLRTMEAVLVSSLPPGFFPASTTNVQPTPYDKACGKRPSQLVRRLCCLAFPGTVSCTLACEPPCDERWPSSDTTQLNAGKCRIGELFRLQRYPDEAFGS
jgi:hypothetical protein